MGKKRGEYKKYLYDLNIEMPKSTHYKKIKTFLKNKINFFSSKSRKNFFFFDIIIFVVVFFITL